MGWLEALFLSLALSVDNVIAVLGASLSTSLPLYTPVAMGLVQVAFMFLGLRCSAWLHRGASAASLPSGRNRFYETALTRLRVMAARSQRIRAEIAWPDSLDAAFGTSALQESP